MKCWVIANQRSVAEPVLPGLRKREKGFFCTDELKTKGGGLYMERNRVDRYMA